jgi:antirestriction protein ArdC
MSSLAARFRSSDSRPGLYQEITDKIVAELETGRVPWVQPWRTAAASAPLAMPKNASTGRCYSGKRSGCRSCNGQRFSRS